MDLKKTLHVNSRRKHKKGETAQLAAQLAPLEEQDGQRAKQPPAGQESISSQADPHFSEIVVDDDNLHVPQDILEGGGEKTYLGMEPVVLVILGIMLVFIAFIAWQISLLPVE